MFKSQSYLRYNLILFLSVFFISSLAVTPLLSILVSLGKTIFSNNLLEKSFLFEYIKNSFFILFFVLISTTILGLLTAHLVSFYNFYGAKFFKYSLILSLAVPPYIYGYSLGSFLENYGTAYSILSFFKPELENTILPNFSAITMTIISLSFSLFGYIYLMSMTTFNSQMGNYLELTKTLRMSRYDKIIKIIIPLSRPAIFIGMSLVAMETLSDFGTVSFFGVSTLTTGIYNAWFIFDDIHTSNFFSILLLGFILIFFLIENFFQKKKKFHNSINSNTRVKKTTLTGFHALVAFLICLSVFLLSFIFPFCQMLYWSIKNIHYVDNLNVLELNFNTLILIVTTSLFLILFSFFCNFGNRALKNNTLIFISNLSISGYAIPGILIAIAVITFLSGISNIFGLNFKSMFIGSFYGLILGYFFRFYSIAFNGIKTNYLKISNQIDESGYLLGLSKLKVFAKVHFPILRENSFFIFILIALEIIKELPITLILRPFNFETFSTKAFDFASQDLIEAASLPSLFLIMWATLLIVISSKYFLKK